MSKYDKAIEYFDEAIRESDAIIAVCSPDLQAELTEQKAHFEVALAAMWEQEAARVLLKECLNQLEIHCDTCGDRSRGNCSDQSEQCGTQKMKDQIEEYLEQ
jgi:hypothetical protein